MVVCVVCSSVVGLVVVVVVEVVGRIGCWGLLLTTSLSIESHVEPLRRGEPSLVVREIAVVSGNSGWLYVCIEVVVTSLGWSSLFPSYPRT